MAEESTGGTEGKAYLEGYRKGSVLDKRSSRWKFRLGVWEGNGSGGTEYRLFCTGEKTKQQNSVSFWRQVETDLFSVEKE